MSAAIEISRWIEDRADEMAGLLMELVAIDSQNPPGRGLPECAEVLRGVLFTSGSSPRIIACVS